MRPILASVLVFACAREAVADDLAATYGALFNDHVDITFTGYSSGSNQQADFPLLVRLSEGNPAGFSYARVDKSGKEIRFLYYGLAGSDPVAVPYEVDTWNASGTSTLWVKVPVLNNAAARKLTMYWAPSDSTALPANDSRAVWGGFTSVWHMNGAADSSPNNVSASKGAAASSGTGVVGASLESAGGSPYGPLLSAPAGTVIDNITTGAYTISGWVRVDSLSSDSSWFYTRQTTSSAAAYGAELVSLGAGAALKLHANASDAPWTSSKVADLKEWVHLAVECKGVPGAHVVYKNGVKLSSDWTASVSDQNGSAGFALGGLFGAGASGTLAGALDEVRIFPGLHAKGASWAKAEYEQVANSDYLSFGTVSSTGAEVYPETDEDEDGSGSGGSSDDGSSESGGGTSAPDDFAGTAEFAPAAGALAEGVVLTNFVMLVQVWEGSPAGFVPSQLPFGKEDIRFFDEQGECLNFELERWDVDGTSVFWVKVPRLKSTSRVTMCWGLREGKTLAEVDPTDVWSGYAGVWHMEDERDSSEWNAAGAFGPNATNRYDGAIGRAAQTKVTGANGAILDVEASSAVELLTNGTFTASGYVLVNKTATKYGYLFSRATADDSAWGAQFCGGSSGDSSKIAMHAGAASKTAAVSLGAQTWARFDFVYAPNRMTFYLNGAEVFDETVVSGRALGGLSGRLAIGSLVSTSGLAACTLNGAIDEFRLRAGRPSESVLAAEYGQVSRSDYYEKSASTWDATAILQNRWKREPGLSKTSWKQGEDPATVDLGEAWYGVATVVYENRETGETSDEMPTAGGDYRAIFTVPQAGNVSALAKEVNFRIRRYNPTHDLGAENDRVLLLNDDRTVADGLVEVQAYNHTVSGTDRPYWWHDVDSDCDYTSTSPYYNFCGGTRHTYYAGDGRRLWDLIGVRYGNTYNNADWVFDQTGEWEEWGEGLSDEMNYLPWNPDGGRLVDLAGGTAAGWHEFAAQAVMCNALGASVNSCLYTNGIGTIYFDCVNSHTNDAPFGCYELVVEYATNALTRVEDPARRVPYGVPTDANIEATHTEWRDGVAVEVVDDPYEFADWKRLTLHVQLVKDGELSTNVWTTDALTLDRTDGGSYKTFYRVYVPVDCLAQSRFRIRRTAVNPDYTYITDVHSMILVDNVICSKPTDRISVEPRGPYDPLKTGLETVGCEGTFLPSYPSLSDSEVYARVRIKDAPSSVTAKRSVSVIEMHYRWCYLNQQSNAWQSVDIDPLTLVSEKPLTLPRSPGDIEFWFEVNQSGEFYRYADYSGLGLGLPDYSEEVSSVTNRADTWETYGKDWFARIRDGASACGNVRVIVRNGDDGGTKTVRMTPSRDHVWRGCLMTTNAVTAGLSYRVEVIDRQDDTLADFQYNTNCWYAAEAATSLPASSKLVNGTTNDWGHVPCDAATGHILFQVDDETRAISVVHADWQDFNEWDDLDSDLFSGSTTDDGTKKGTSPQRRTYAWAPSLWEVDSATNDEWSEAFAPDVWTGYDFFRNFTSEISPNGFEVGRGMWVPGAYADVRDHHSGMALQMTGQGLGYFLMANRTPSPRGLESVRFSARLAQSVTPDQFSLYDDGATLCDYSFLTRVAFDLNRNSNFVGNASLSLAAFMRDKRGCYEARWEQIDGNVQTGTGKILGPSPRGQRLALYRWRRSGQTWVATELMAATNSDYVCTWQESVCPRGIPMTTNVTKNLMPFYIGAYNNESQDYTVVITGVRIGGKKVEADNQKEGGVSADAGFYTVNQNGWLYLVYRDTRPDRLKSGTYGLLASNCEGVFVRPQYHQGIVSWEADAEDTKTLNTCICPDGSTTRSGYQQAHFLEANATNCVRDIIDEWWSENDGRLGAFYDTPYDNVNGFTNQTVNQTVEVYTKAMGTDEKWELAASKTLRGFGTPGVLRDQSFDFWEVDDVDVKIAPGGTDTDPKTDVVIDNIEISQWRGANWLGITADDKGRGGPTNFVYTSGWVTEDALQLSAKRTASGTPSSLRVPLCDGLGSRSARRGIGLGMIAFEYRNATTNMRLQVQVITNDISANTLLSKTLAFDGWTTLTNIDFSTMTDAERAHGRLSCSPGLHGIAGTMRLLVDPTLVDEVKSVTNESAFGSIDLVEVMFRDEPALDSHCWWGWNVRTIGGVRDPNDSEKRSFLPDNPYRSVPPALKEYGRSFALNNSITDGIDPAETEMSPNPYSEHIPFLQTPTFVSNTVGEVSFKARKYSLNRGSQHAEVSLYGTPARAGAKEVIEGDWELLKVFIVSNTVYESFSHKINQGEGFKAFRFAVAGVDGVADNGHEPTCGTDPVRVLLDEVLVSEAIRARLAFRNVGAFRSDMAGTAYVPNVPSADEQPLCQEGWGVQAEVYPAMLGEEIDLTDAPRVRLHYFVGDYPWGFSNWRNLADAVCVDLPAASGTNLIYRSSYLASNNSVIPMATEPNTVVQYMLEVQYAVVDSEHGGTARATNWLESADWPLPSWYRPVDYNAWPSPYGRGLEANFSAFAIIDEIAPGWAWINEANIFGTLNGLVNSDVRKQFVEIAKPAEYDLNGWWINMLCYKGGVAPAEGTAAITTNKVATFGRNGVSKTKSTKYMSQGMTFMVVAGQGAEETTLFRSSTDPLKDETLEGIWNFMTVDETVFCSGGVIGHDAPFGVQLVRPTGIVEHEIVLIGTNLNASSRFLEERFNPTNLVNRLNQVDDPARFFYAGSDCAGGTKSVGVYDSRGEAAEWWNNTTEMTPGRVNKDQRIGSHPTPSGEQIIVFANVDTGFGHIVQTVGSGTNTTEGQIVAVRRDDPSGLAIRYTVDPWYELGEVDETEDGEKRIPIVVTNATRSYTVTVARNAQKNVNVTASAAIAKNLRDLGVDEKNRYTPAILRWLEQHQDLFENDFYDWESGEIKLAKFLALSGNVERDMTLTEMYWLDMDPTVGEMYFRAGMVRPPSTVVVPQPTYDPSLPEAATNLRVGVYMSISNGNGLATSGWTVWSPYVLRGLGLGETSKDYSPDSPNSWTSVTFKVTGFMNNSSNDVHDADCWIPLRYFVFHEDSFDANHEAEIDVADPFSTRSPAYARGWADWVKRRGGEKPPVYLSWNIDEQLQPVTATVLAPTNRLDGAEQ